LTIFLKTRNNDKILSKRPCFTDPKFSSEQLVIEMPEKMFKYSKDNNGKYNNLDNLPGTNDLLLREW
jgi:hypothetical protein